ncbi:MAG: cytochrome P450 [Thermoleophilia bacterium]|nr:cytochrome P450 [Thermoleophilia bacterium]
MTDHTPPTAASQRRMRRLDSRLLLVAHPFATRFVNTMRKRRVIKIPGLGVLLNDGTLMRKVLLDGTTYIKGGDAGAGPMLDKAIGPYSLMNIDGEEHRELRRQIGPLTTPAKAREACAATTDEHFAHFRDRMLAGEVMDAAQLAHVVAGAAVCYQVGVRKMGEELAAHALEVHHHSTIVSSQMSVISWSITDRKIRLVTKHIDAMTEPVRDAWAENDTTTIAGVLGSHGQSWQNTRGVIASYLLAGVDTSAAAMGRLMALLIDGNVMPDLCADPKLIPQVVNEALRYLAPIPMFTRTITCPHQLGDTQVPAGVQLLPVVLNCLHDPHLLNNPNVLDIHREIPKELRKLWFGAGQHFCPGQALANQILADAVRMMIELGPNLEIVRRKAARKTLLPCYAKLELRRPATT